MSLIVFVSLLSGLWAGRAVCFFSIPQLDEVEEQPLTSDPGEPLFVTAYLRSAEGVRRARELAQVRPLAGRVKSYAGYLTVDSERNSNLFFWFFPSEKEPAVDPLILWLHGGPGHSSAMALFNENGPYVLADGRPLLRNDTRWTLGFSVLYVDNPVGAGFSFTDASDGYSTTAQHAARNLHRALGQFYVLFSEYRANRLVLAGQSYAGKYIPVLAQLIHQKNKHQAANLTVNLAGLFIGCGFINPAKQIRYADFMYENGIVDWNDRNVIAVREEAAREASERNRYYVATYQLAMIASKMLLAGYNPPYDVQQPNIDFGGYDQTAKFLQNATTRAAIHVGAQKFQGNAKVVWCFRADFYRPVISQLSATLDHYKVLLYAGQFDMIIPPSQIDHVVASLTWDKLKEFDEAERHPWYVAGQLAGYTKSFNNLQQVFVRRANHAVVGSQPVYLFDLLKKYCAAL